MYQKIIIVGNLGRDPEMREVGTGNSVCSFSVATNRSYTDKSGQKVKETVWFRVGAWGRLGETCNQYLSKGRKVLVEGRLEADPETGGPRVWTGQDGNARASFEINASTVQFLSSRGEGDGDDNGGEPAFGAPGNDGFEEVPF